MITENCFYCNNNCGQSNKVKNYLKPTFTNLDIIGTPNSEYICDECVWAFSTGNQEIILLDGEIRQGQSPRLYSWIITDKKIAATKTHIKQLREIILNPPLPPFKIILSDSGQKHLLFRAIWALSQDNFPIQFEEEQIIINILNLKERLTIADKLSAAIGKVALNNCEKMSYAITINNYYDDLTDYENWLNIKNEPLSRLAVWLAKNKEDARNEYPTINTGSVQAANSRPNRPIKKNGRIRDEGNDERDSQLRIDFAGSI
jgi:CRISPR type IV-associated protein Csf1